jgi:hypothetical protein
MKALTLTQPWATLVAIGAKQIETRSWRTFYRGPLAIHAAKSLPAWQFRDVLEAHGINGFMELPLGAVIATCSLVECERITPGNIPAAPEVDFGDYTIGRWAWHLSDVKALIEPVPVRGSLGLWEWVSTA